ncbi:MAG TPA: copper chaperone PCu(A)C, partial [Phenylobacterium sp.]|nr:copper chaperone PCu(A)C [Phenylobacterium sp.]
LTAASSPAGERVEIHTMTTEGGIMRMRELSDGLPLPAGESVALRPGAEHLMLMAPAAALNEGESVEITLTFEKAPAQTLTAQVRSAPHGMGH